MLAGVAEVEIEFCAERIVDRAFDQRAMFGDVAQAHFLIVVREIDLAHPDERMAAFGAAAVGNGIVVVTRFLASFGSAARYHVITLPQGDVREAATDDVEQQGIARFRDRSRCGSHARIPARRGLRAASARRIRSRRLRRRSGRLAPTAAARSRQRIIAPPPDRLISSTSCSSPSKRARALSCSSRCRSSSRWLAAALFGTRDRDGRQIVFRRAALLLLADDGSPECRPFPVRMALRKLFIETTSHAMAR